MSEAAAALGLGAMDVPRSGAGLHLPASGHSSQGRRERVPIDSWSVPLLSRLSLLAAPFRSRRAARRGRAAARLGHRLKDLTPSDFAARRRAVGATLRRNGLAGGMLVEALAIAAEAARRALDLSPYPGQLAAAAGLAAGEVVEMDTGEGKTLAAFLAAAVCAMAGRDVHVVTANDYLAERDHAHLEPAFRLLGISTGVVIGGVPPETRRLAYGADVTFLSSKEVAFDYLRDGLARDRAVHDGNLVTKLGRVLGHRRGREAAPLQRSLDVAIVDEIDSVLVDEAGTPLIISADDGEGTDADNARRAEALAADLAEGRDFTIDPHGLLPTLTRAGLARIEEDDEEATGAWRIRLRRQEMARAALAARHTLVRDRDYLVRDGKIVIVDPHSGRVMADRHWGHDLHAMVEIKEGLELTGRRKSLASISYQRFFRNYRHLAGMSGTVREVARELAAVYELPLTRIRRRLPLRRRHAGRHVFRSREALWSHVGDAVAARHGLGQPILVAVRSVGEARRAAEALERHGIPHDILSAAHDRAEAEIVARAGELGSVAVVTNMAGRGTDIRLAPGASERGGLLVMICERHESRRVDRQLMGRAARQGDPGEIVEYLSGEDGILGGLGAVGRRSLSTWIGRALFGGWIFRRAQLRTERVQVRRRFDLVRRDERLAKTLAFAGGLD